MNIGYIYSLKDIQTKNIFYVGACSSPRSRLLSHKALSAWDDGPLYKYIRQNNIAFKMGNYIPVGTGVLYMVEVAQNDLL